MRTFLCFLSFLLGPNFIFASTKSSSIASSDQRDETNYYFKLFTGGLPAFFYQDLARASKSSLNVSSSCKSSLKLTAEGLTQERQWAFKFLDASSKTPPGFLEGSIAGFGDFDECLALDTPAGQGAYCMLEFEQFKESKQVRERGSVGSAINELIPMKDYFSPRIAICVPSACDSKDVLEHLRSTMVDHPFGVTDRITCQTKQELDTLMDNLSTAQKLSVTFLSTLIVMLIGSSLFDKLTMYTSNNRIVASFSLTRNVRSLFKADNARNDAVDIMKLCFAMLFVSIHSVSGSDNPYGPLIISRLSEALRDTQKPIAQIMISDSLVEVMFLMGGFTAMYSLYPRLTSGRPASLAWLLFDKWIRCVPIIFGLLALEYCWPLIGSGPFYKMGSEFVLANCDKHWLLTVLQISNWSPPLEKCAPQLFHSAVDFQLFALVGLPLAVLLIRHRRAGLTISAALIATCSLYLWNVARVKKLIPNYIARDATLAQMMDFMSEVHYPSYTHAPAYIIGLLIGYKVATKTTIEISAVNRQVLTALCTTASLVAAFSPTLHNTFNALPLAAVPYYIVAQKLLYICGLFPILLPIKVSEGGHNEATNAGGQKVTANEDLVASGKVSTQLVARYSLLKGICRLTFSLYLINYYCIRYDFLTSRVPFQAGIYHAQKRFIFSLFVTFFAASAFHLLVLAPFDNLRKSLMAPLKVHENAFNEGNSKVKGA